MYNVLQCGSIVKYENVYAHVSENCKIKVSVFIIIVKRSQLNANDNHYL